MMAFGDHLEVLRRMLFRVLGLATIFVCVIFCYKQDTFFMLLAPCDSSFYTYKVIEKILAIFNIHYQFEKIEIDLITTELSSQFIIHITTSFILGLLVTSPYIVYEFFKFISPALYKEEKKYSIPIVISSYLLFFIGIIINYFIIFPFALRFLGTYSVSETVHSTITLDSYVDTFISLSFMMGIVFQLPVIAFILSKLGIIDSVLMINYRKHALIIIMLIAAIITPPDIMTLILVSLPLYLLYEASIIVVKFSSVSN